jgi:hypothetical protein
MIVVIRILRIVRIATAGVAVWSIMIGVAVTIARGGTNCVPAPSGLMSWWKGEDDTLDQTGTNNGTVYGSPMSYAPGEVGQAFYFDGGGGSILEVGDATNLELQNLTIEGWIKRGDSTSVGSGGGQAVLFGFVYEGYEFGIYDNGTLYLSTVGGDFEVDCTNQLVGDTNFHYLAVTKSGTDVLIYIDGTGFAMPPYISTFVFDVGRFGAAIGCFAEDGAYPFWGIIDELSVYNRPLTAGEIQAIYSAGSAGKCLTLAAPFIFDEPTNITAFRGTTATLAVVANGAQPLSYQWFFDRTNILGATNATLSITNAQPSDAGSYGVILSNSYGVLASSNSVLTVDLIPDILSQPTNEAVGAYYPVLFSIGAVGPLPLLYQWTFDGTNLTGATNSTLFFGAALPSEAGTYSVIVGTPPNTTNSSNAVLTVTLPPPPTILTQPASHIGVVNDYTTFTVTAQSQAPVPTYFQWRFHGAKLPGATNSELVISNLALTDAGTYTVQVFNPFFTTNSQPAVLTMIPAPTGTNRIVANLDPNELTRAVLEGGSVTFVCSGTITLSQPIVPWHAVIVDGGGYDITLSGGETNQMLAIPSGVNVGLRNLTFSDGVANDGGAISNNGSLTAEAVNFTGNIAIVAGGAIFNTGSLSLTGVRFSNNIASPQWSFLTAGPLEGGNEAFGGAIWTSNATVNLTNVIFSGNSAEGSVYGSSAYGGGIYDIGGAMSLANVVFDGNAAQGGSANGTFVDQGWGFGGALFSSGGSITGSAIECTNNAALSGDGQVMAAYGMSGAICAPGTGQGGAFCLTNGIAVFSNCWFTGNWATCSTAYNQPTASSEGGALYNAGWTTLTDVGFLANYCLGANGAPGSELSDAPFIGTPGGPASGGVGGAVCNLGLLLLTNCAFTANTVTASNGGPGSFCTPCNPQYTAPSGAPGNALGGALANYGAVNIFSNAFLNNAASGPGTDVGTIYSVGNFQIDTNTTISPDTVDSVTNASAPFFALMPQSQVGVAESTVTFSALAVGFPEPTYQWTWNGTNLSAATAPTLVLTNVQPNQSGTYSVEAMNSAGSETSAPVVLTVLAAPITLTGNNLGPAGFSISGTGVPGINFVIEVSTDLVDWQPLSTNPSPFTFIDTNTSTAASRYYRAAIAH